MQATSECGHVLAQLDRAPNCKQRGKWRGPKMHDDHKSLADVIGAVEKGKEPAMSNSGSARSVDLVSSSLADFIRQRTAQITKRK